MRRLSGSLKEWDALMGWLEKLQAAGAKATEEKSPEAPKPRATPAEVHQVTVSVRGAHGSDPGEITLGWFTFEGGRVQMIDEKGEPIGGPISVNPSVDPRAVARAETVRRWNENGRYGRRIEYPRVGIV